MDPKLKPTPEEKRAIDVLKRLAETWPKSLWLYSASGSLCVMRCGADGKPVFEGRHGGVDPAYEVDEIQGIHNGGGDW